MMLLLPLQRNTNHATVRSEDAPYPQTQQLHRSPNDDDKDDDNDDLNPTPDRRRRAQSTSSHSISAADQQELCEFLFKNLSYGAGTPIVAPLHQSTISRDEPGAHRHMESISDVYSFAHERMIASVQRPSDGKYQAPTEYGPYHAQFWSLVENNLETELPQPSNGGYQSPYGTLAPDVYFGSTSDQTNTAYTDTTAQNGFDHPDGSAYTLGRHTQYQTSLPQEPVNVYPSPVDNFGWNYFSGPQDASQQKFSTLDNLASQILNMLLSYSMEDVASNLFNSSTANGQAFSNLQSLFEQAAGQFPYNQSNTFIDVHQMQLSSVALLNTVRKANLASFVTILFRGRDIPFIELNAAFLDTFMPTGTCLLKHEASLFLEFKTQAYLAMVMGHNYPRELLDQLFPRDLQLNILRRRAEPPHLAPSEQDFISLLNSRRQYLLACSDDMETLSQLPQKYSWNSFLGELRACVGRALEYLDRTKAASSAGASPSEDPITKAALAAHAAISGQGSGSMHPYRSPSLLRTSDFGSSERQQSSPASDSSMSPESPHAPMHLQYRTGRPQGVPKSQSPYPNATQRRQQNAPSTRRPWSPEEEKALMDGLERVKGPHWSQILALYGVGGSISEILKDRNQVQLKDKARNLKLFFLKSGLEVPYFLQKVTGELKTRAPAQAAKLEARERLKRMEEQKP